MVKRNILTIESLFTDKIKTQNLDFIDFKSFLYSDVYFKTFFSSLDGFKTIGNVTLGPGGLYLGTDPITSNSQVSKRYYGAKSVDKLFFKSRFKFITADFTDPNAFEFLIGAGNEVTGELFFKIKLINGIPYGFISIYKNNQVVEEVNIFNLTGFFLKHCLVRCYAIRVDNQLRVKTELIVEGSIFSDDRVLNNTIHSSEHFFKARLTRLNGTDQIGMFISDYEVHGDAGD